MVKHPAFQGKVKKSTVTFALLGFSQKGSPAAPAKLVMREVKSTCSVSSHEIRLMEAPN
jgi:hypothetical protein